MAAAILSSRLTLAAASAQAQTLTRRLIGSVVGKKRETLSVEADGGIVRVWFNRESVLNAIGLTMAKEFLDLALVLRETKAGYRCVVLSGKGKAFCTGRDLKESKTHTKSDADQFQHLVMECTARWQEVPVPTIAAINGHCFGWGLEAALASDIRYVVDDATLCLPECGLGIFPGAGGAVTLPRTINVGLAKELIFTSRKFTGKDAEKYGLVNQSYATQEALFAAVNDVATRIAKNGPLGVRGAKKVISESRDHTMAEGLAFSNKHRLPLNQTEDFAEALKAFEEKRAPVFKGI